MRLGFAGLLAAMAIAAAAHAQTANVEAYIGKNPFGDRIDGRTLYEIPELRRDFIAKFGEHRWAQLLSFQTSVPIETVTDPALGKVIVVQQCKPHDCPNEAVLLLQPSGAIIGACFATVLISTSVEWLSPTRRTRVDREDCGQNAAERVEQFKLALQN
jgi:hypothetical protein